MFGQLAADEAFAFFLLLSGKQLVIFILPCCSVFYCNINQKGLPIYYAG